ncbi:hypothetical protein HZB02_05970 [Candidatus Woesearchaeota archaeon]|nr:hypothetical protein [Candidatus Woesearchaeota archaeon]
MIPLRDLLLHYKRPEIREEIVLHAEDREVAIKFGEKGFGKRPDILRYPNDILTLVQQGASSFHCSEERWKNPLDLTPGLPKHEMDNNRIGFDLILDIDCHIWEYSKLTAELLIKALQHSGIEAVSCKFSGNKGFHIGVPFEAFPTTINNVPTTTLFPELPRKVAAYLSSLIEKPLATRILETNKIQDVLRKSGKTFEEVVQHDQLKPFTFIELDTLLISSRHLYRMPYSFNEKSSLVSVPIDPRNVMSFEREYAQYEKIAVSPYRFLDRQAKPNEAKDLLTQAMDFKVKEQMTERKDAKMYTFEEESTEAIPEMYFPDCVKKLLAGMQDGRKRALFILTNFLSTVGWSHEQIEARIHEWNKLNPEPLREVLIKGHLSHLKRSTKKMLPPNCDNPAYYAALGVKCSDCSRWKNPVFCAKMRMRIASQEPGRKKKKQQEKKAETKEVQEEKNEPSNSTKES